NADEGLQTLESQCVSISGWHESRKTNKLRLKCLIVEYTFSGGYANNPEMVELFYFSELGLRKEDIGGWSYQLTFKHTDENELKRQFSELLDNIWSTADGYHCIVESDVDEGLDYL
ncbi:MAG: hypothetical protein AAF572_28770, partial [Cyanobacteria bacterium P01_B01_bin.77]